MNYPQLNKSERTIELQCNDYFVVSTSRDITPIDNFYNVCSDLVKLTKPSIVDGNPIITRLIILGYVSAVEEYFRSIFCEIINLCPFIRENVSDKQIKFGSIDYYDKSRLAEGLLELNSLASMKEIISNMNKLLGISVNSNSSLYAALSQYDKVCNLRHCAVHCGGSLNANNAKQIGVDKECVGRSLQPTPIQLQDALGVCYSLVRAFNQNVFEEILNKWKKEKFFQGSWKLEREQFEKLLNVFWSTADMGTMTDIKNKYRDIFNKVSPKDIIPDNDRNNIHIQNIFEKFFTDSDYTSLIPIFDNFTESEVLAVLDKLVYYDDESAIILIENMIELSLNEMIKINSIKYLLDNSLSRSIYIEQIKNVIDSTANKDIKLKAIKILIDNYEFTLINLYSYLIDMESEYIFAILKELQLIDWLDNIYEITEMFYDEIIADLSPAPDNIYIDDIMEYRIKAIDGNIEMFIWVSVCSEVENININFDRILFLQANSNFEVLSKNCFREGDLDL